MAESLQNQWTDFNARQSNVIAGPHFGPGANVHLTHNQYGASSGAAAPYMVPRDPTPTFTGREDLLQHISSAFDIAPSVDDTSNDRQACVAITGIGGVGKSELCLEFIRRNRQHFWGVFWIDCMTESTISESYSSIGVLLGLSNASSSAAKSYLASLDTTKRWLLVLDNADDPDMDYSKFLPVTISGCILLTTRTKRVCRLATKLSIELAELEQTVAERLLVREAGIDQQHDAVEAKDVTTLVTTLDCYALAIVVAGSFMRQFRCTARDYLQLYSSDKGSAYHFKLDPGQSTYASVHATFEVSIARLQHAADIGKRQDAADALDLFSLLPYFHYQGSLQIIFQTAIMANREGFGIPKPPFEQWELPPSHQCCDRCSEPFSDYFPNGSTFNGSTRWLAACKLLEDLSLIRTSKKNKALQFVHIHPIIHAWATTRQQSPCPWSRVVMMLGTICLASSEGHVEANDIYHYSSSVQSHMLRVVQTFSAERPIHDDKVVPCLVHMLSDLSKSTTYDLRSIIDWLSDVYVKSAGHGLALDKDRHLTLQEWISDSSPQAANILLGIRNARFSNAMKRWDVPEASNELDVLLAATKTSTYQGWHIHFQIMRIWLNSYTYTQISLRRAINDVEERISERTFFDGANERNGFILFLAEFALYGRLYRKAINLCADIRPPELGPDNWEKRIYQMYSKLRLRSILIISEACGKLGEYTESQAAVQTYLREHKQLYGRRSFWPAEEERLQYLIDRDLILSGQMAVVESSLPELIARLQGFQYHSSIIVKCLTDIGQYLWVQGYKQEIGDAANALVDQLSKAKQVGHDSFCRAKAGLAAVELGNKQYDRAYDQLCDMVRLKDTTCSLCELFFILPSGMIVESPLRVRNLVRPIYDAHLRSFSKYRQCHEWFSGILIATEMRIGLVLSNDPSPKAAWHLWQSSYARLTKSLARNNSVLLGRVIDGVSLCLLDNALWTAWRILHDHSRYLQQKSASREHLAQRLQGLHGFLKGVCRLLKRRPRLVVSRRYYARWICSRLWYSADFSSMKLHMGINYDSHGIVDFDIALSQDSQNATKESTVVGSADDDDEWEIEADAEADNRVADLKPNDSRRHTRRKNPSTRLRNIRHAKRSRSQRPATSPERLQSRSHDDEEEWESASDGDSADFIDSPESGGDARNDGERPESPDTKSNVLDDAGGEADVNEQALHHVSPMYYL